MADVYQRSVHTGKFHLKMGNVLADLCWQANLAGVHELLTRKRSQGVKFITC